MLQIRDLDITMKKDLRQLLKGFTFALQPGDKAALIGEEGNGKSTLLKLLYDPALVEAMWNTQGPFKKTACFWDISPRSCPQSRGN